MSLLSFAVVGATRINWGSLAGRGKAHFADAAQTEDAAEG